MNVFNKPLMAVYYILEPKEVVLKYIQPIYKCVCLVFSEEKQKLIVIGYIFPQKEHSD